MMPVLLDRSLVSLPEAVKKARQPGAIPLTDIDLDVQVSASAVHAVLPEAELLGRGPRAGIAAWTELLR